MQKKKKAKKENSERWLLTYSDLITLLMILFILLYAMSNVSQEKYNALQLSLSEALGGKSGVLEGTDGVLDGSDGVLPSTDEGQSGTDPEITQAAATPTPTAAPEQTDENIGEVKLAGSITTEKDMKNFQNYFNDILKELKIDDYVKTSIMNNGLVATFSNDVFFDSGDDSLKAEMITGLDKLASLLNKIDNPIIVEGHTDNVKMSQYSKYASNWQLSAARAANVVQYLVEQCKVDGSRISAIGYGEYHPKASNKTADGRARNRRIDIIILYDKLND